MASNIKLKLRISSDDIRRISLPSASISLLLDRIDEIFLGNGEPSIDRSKLRLHYVDNEGDRVIVSTDGELEEALAAQSLNGSALLNLSISFINPSPPAYAPAPLNPFPEAQTSGILQNPPSEDFRQRFTSSFVPSATPPDSFKPFGAVPQNVPPPTPAFEQPAPFPSNPFPFSAPLDFQQLWTFGTEFFRNLEVNLARLINYGEQPLRQGIQVSFRALNLDQIRNLSMPQVVKLIFLVNFFGFLVLPAFTLGLYLTGHIISLACWICWNLVLIKLVFFALRYTSQKLRGAAVPFPAQNAPFPAPSPQPNPQNFARGN